ncbi:MAG: site-specific integrase, partial [Phycisphaerae bacterium]|nr:site-specific integrase [Phycisphaerae bacterium]
HPDRAGGSRTSARWTCEFRWRGKTCRLGLFTDHRASVEVARRIERLMALRQAGDGPDPDIARWLEQAPRKVVAYLAKHGILDPRRVAATKTLDEHLDDWQRALHAKGSSPRHIELVVSRARRLLADCGWSGWSDIRAAAVADHLAARRCDQHDHRGTLVRRSLSYQTSNFYLAAVKQFCRWMVRDGRASESPVQHIDPVNVRVDRRHDRRAWQPDELRRLIETAQRGPERFGMTGPERALTYRLAAETGLRAGELRSLTRASFDLDSANASVTILAAYAKNRRQDTLPLRPETAALLRARWARKSPAATVCNLPRREIVTRMLRGDLLAARQAWLDEAPDATGRGEREQSDFLAYRDRAGRFLDFHSLRHGFISYLVVGGVHPKVAQRLARHGSITLTLDRYTHLLGGDDAAALAVLPDLSAAPAVLTADRRSG